MSNTQKNSRGKSHKGSALILGMLTTLLLAGCGIAALLLFTQNHELYSPKLPEMVASISKTTAAAETEASSDGQKETNVEKVPASEDETADDSGEEASDEEDETFESSFISSDEELALREAALSKYQNLAVVTGVTNYLNMRSGPSSDSEVCGKIFPYCGVDILQDAGNGWYQVSSGGVTGYVAAQYLTGGAEGRALALEHCRHVAEVVTDDLDVLYKPKKSSDVILTVKNGDVYSFISYSGDYALIEAVEDLSGYVPVEAIKTYFVLDEAIVFGYDNSVSQVRRDIINRAFEYYGNPYVFGGRDFENGIDCSAFTYLIYKDYGIDLVEMYSGTQATVGTAVSEADIKPGDLLFYVGRIAGQIGHVAIYIGNGKIIHAASESKGICVSDWKYVPIVTIRNVIGD